MREIPGEGTNEAEDDGVRRVTTIYLVLMDAWDYLKADLLAQTWREGGRRGGRRGEESSSSFLHRSIPSACHFTQSKPFLLPATKIIFLLIHSHVIIPQPLTSHHSLMALHCQSSSQHQPRRHHSSTSAPHKSLFSHPLSLYSSSWQRSR